MRDALHKLKLRWLWRLADVKEKDPEDYGYTESEIVLFLRNSNNVSLLVLDRNREKARGPI